MRLDPLIIASRRSYANQMERVPIVISLQGKSQTFTLSFDKHFGSHSLRTIRKCQTFIQCQFRSLLQLESGNEKPPNFESQQSLNKVREDENIEENMISLTKRLSAIKIAQN